MSETFHLILRGGACATPSGLVQTDIGVRGGKIAAIGDLGRATATEIFDVKGLHVLPGVIDGHVHFREPGGEHKEDFSTGSAAAALGGVTAVFEMPNATPSTVGAAELADKCRRAKDRAWVDMAFFVGATGENIAELSDLEQLQACAGVKIFMGSSTGSLLVEDDATLAAVLASGTRRAVVHCEDEGRLNARKSLLGDAPDVAMHSMWRDAEAAAMAARRLVGLARGVGRRVHIAHASSGLEMEAVKDYHDIATIEVSPHHLSLVAPDAYAQHGTRVQVNPPIREQRDVDALWRAVAMGLVDTIGSDHAPHAADEKDVAYPNSPSGLPGVQTLVPVMLTHVNAGRLSLERFVDLTSAGPARVFGIAGKGRIALGYDADFTIVDLAVKRTITNRWIVSRCGWTPFDGFKAKGWPVATVVRGHTVARDGALVGEPVGTSVQFLETLQ